MVKPPFQAPAFIHGDTSLVAVIVFAFVNCDKDANVEL